MKQRSCAQPPSPLLVAERFHVGEVLRSCGGALVLDECTAPDHGYRAALELEGLTVCDGFSKSDAVGTIDDVDPSRGDPDLKNAIVRRKVLDTYFE